MTEINLGKLYLEEMQAEVTATRKCLERIDEKTWDFKPHEKSMKMGYLALLVAEIPKWLAQTINPGVIDFETFRHESPANKSELVKHFEENLKAAEDALGSVSNEQLHEMFYLKHGDNILMQMTKKNSISSSINHWVHHRGQLTVYMRLNNIDVPSIYGPSADDPNF